MINRLLKNQVLTTFGARGMAAGGTFLLTYVLAALVEPSIFGGFMLCVSIMIGMQVFISMGTDRAALKFIGVALSHNNKNEMRWIYKKTLSINCVTGLLLSAALWLAAPSISNVFLPSTAYAVESIRITALMSVAYGIIYMCNFIMKGWGRANISCLFEIGFISIFLSFFILIYSFLGFDFDVASLLVCLFVILLIYLVVAVLVVVKIYTAHDFVIDDSSSFPRGFYSKLPDYFLVGLIFYYIQWGVGVLLGGFATESEVAIFNLGLRIAMVVGFVLTVYDSILGPRFSRLHYESRLIELKELAQKSAFQMTCIAFIPAMLFLIWPNVVAGFFNSSYSGVSDVLRIMVFGQFVNVITGSIILLLLMCELEKLARNILLGSVFLGAASALVLIPMYGPIGAAGSVFITLLVQNVAGVLAVKKYFGFWVFDWRFMLEKLKW